MDYYYHLHSESPYVGTDKDEVIVTNDPELQIDIEDIKQEIFDDYGYLINGWNEEEPNEEQIEEFFDNCDVYINRISFDTAVSMIIDDGCSVCDLR